MRMPEPVPSGAIDAHVHVFDPAGSRYPADAGYIPRQDELRGVDDLMATLDAAGIDRAVLVQPSCYGTDNTIIMDLVSRLPRRWGGVGVVCGATSSAELEVLRRAGIRGIRLNLRQSASLFEAGGVEQLAAAAGELGLALHVQGEAAALPGLLPRLAAARTIVLDHLGFPDPGRTDVDEVSRLADDPRIIVKLSGAFRLSRAGPPFADIDAYAESILAAFGPHRCVWGSDWPFINTPSRPLYLETLATLTRWAPDRAERDVILCETPARLYFEDR